MIPSEQRVLEQVKPVPSWRWAKCSACGHRSKHLLEPYEATTECKMCGGKAIRERL